jgi:hydrogenase nickel incorporation protein HypA/HybF
MLKDLHRRLAALGTQVGAAQITSVSLWVGALAHVDERQLRARWPEVIGNTAAEHAQLRLEFSDDLADPRADGIVLKDVVVRESELGELAP